MNLAICGKCCQVLPHLQIQNKIAKRAAFVLGNFPFLVLPWSLVCCFSALCFSFSLLQKLAQRLIFGKEHQMLDAQPDERRKKIGKFKESAWKCIYFLSAEILVLYVTYDEPWFGNTKYFWVGPGSQVWPDQKMK
jgi:ceramide synthetase